MSAQLQQEQPKTDPRGFDMADALNRAKQQRQRDLAELKTHEPLARDADTERRALSEAGKNGERVTRSSKLDSDWGSNAHQVQATGPTVPVDPKKRADLRDQVARQYIVDDGRYRFKGQRAGLAFIDRGDRLITASNDERIAENIVLLAASKGWSGVKVKGHRDFKREIWRAAQSQGLTVSGYEPTPQDLALLKAGQEQVLKNEISKADQERSKSTAKTTEAAAQKTSTADTKPNAEKKPLEGILVAHGKARYQHDANNSLSYFARISVGGGEKTVWGKDIERAIKDSKASLGERVQLAQRGKTPIETSQPTKDADGTITGWETVTSMKTTWKVTRLDKAKVVEQVASAVITSKTAQSAHILALRSAVGQALADREKTGTVPEVKVFDHTAPGKTKPSLPLSKQRQKEREQVPERSAGQSR